MKNILLFITLAILILPNLSSAQINSYKYNVSTGEIVHEFLNNPLQARDKYLGENILLTGRVCGKEPIFLASGKKYANLRLFTNDPKYHILIKDILTPSDINSFLDIEEGNDVELICTFDQFERYTNEIIGGLITSLSFKFIQFVNINTAIEQFPPYAYYDTIITSKDLYFILNPYYNMMVSFDRPDYDAIKFLYKKILKVELLFEEYIGFDNDYIRTRCKGDFDSLNIKSSAVWDYPKIYDFYINFLNTQSKIISNLSKGTKITILGKIGYQDLKVYFYDCYLE